jgi:hypothetical protein
MQVYLFTYTSSPLAPSSLSPSPAPSSFSLSLSLSLSPPSLSLSLPSLYPSLSPLNTILIGNKFTNGKETIVELNSADARLYSVANVYDGGNVNGIRNERMKGKEGEGE